MSSGHEVEPSGSPWPRDLAPMLPSTLRRPNLEGAESMAPRIERGTSVTQGHEVRAPQRAAARPA